MNHPLRHAKPWLALAVLLTGAACSGPIGQEPVHVLRDASGRSVAMAGRSQLGNAAPGTMVRARFGGAEQELMVGERIGMAPIFQPGPPQIAEAPAPINSAALEAPPETGAAPAVAPATTRRGRPIASGRPVSAAATETGANPSARRRGPPPRSVSRSVM